MWWEYLLNYLIVFAAGGLICVIAQVLIIKTKLTPARILVLFLIGGIVLQAVGVYDFLYKYLGSGISVPIIGFGASFGKRRDLPCAYRGVCRSFCRRTCTYCLRRRRCGRCELSCYVVFCP